MSTLVRLFVKNKSDWARDLVVARLGGHDYHKQRLNNRGRWEFRAAASEHLVELPMRPTAERGSINHLLPSLNMTATRAIRQDQSKTQHMSAVQRVTGARKPSLAVTMVMAGVASHSPVVWVTSGRWRWWWRHWRHRWKRRGIRKRRQRRWAMQPFRP